ncbi:3-oxoacyl-[acyl-carrier protein] reductase [Natronincola peptidivorans]|uniref:3-oxoacyl-[acyl-carrier protein] reductase n=1 Tax=Natronincola peptidivorans TaxID=426128 RepID=A0A1I0CXS6_9FIRM|nr:SDR family oxidoreductase [Natronincola peptidivorans]SET24656.1 3-oxoacyl-[acyl-carrier protein] reductase [Natronincola peptidivorans]
MIDLKGKNAIITGASRGIGKAIATALAKEGVNLMLVSRSLKDLKKVKEDLQQYAIKIHLINEDLIHSDAPEKIIKAGAENLGALDILINNAGLAMSKKLVDTSIEEWEAHMAVNARAPFLLSTAAIPYLKKSSTAVIINIASVVGSKGYVNQGAYTASKHALMGMTKVLAQEVYAEGIRVHAISPGGVATDMLTAVKPELDTEGLISPEEIADIVVFLIKYRGNAVIDEIALHRATKPPWQ